MLELDILQMFSINIEIDFLYENKNIYTNCDFLIKQIVRLGKITASQKANLSMIMVANLPRPAPRESNQK